MGKLPRIPELGFASKSGFWALPLLVKWKQSGLVKARSPGLRRREAKGTEPWKIVT